MWAALVLACISSLSLSECQVASQNPGYSALSETRDDSVKKQASGETTGSLFNHTSEERGAAAASAVTLATGTSAASAGPAAAPAGPAPRTDAYERYRKKGYTQVDYLINGMYADSEM
uniref:Uncharacterized protein n=1 Tax=Rousettus aegyptiacus TaxID=9407 RepID=A0A7J8GW49_ROUAE|nr:hypothetical protein HJG63_001653 [Rousettus aegyptiacus]